MLGFVLGSVIKYLFVYEIAQSRTIPAQSPIFTAQFASQTPHNFLFFPAPCQKACILNLRVDVSNLTSLYMYTCIS